LSKIQEAITTRHDFKASQQKNNLTPIIYMMHTPNSTHPLRFDSTIFEDTLGQLETGISLPSNPMITITEIALQKIVEMKERLEVPVKGLRVTAIPRSVLRAGYLLRFVPAEEPESPTDSIHTFDGINLYIATDSAAYLEGATIDFVFKLTGSEFKVEAPLRKLDTSEGRIAVKIQQVLDEEINPSLATHGGGAILIDFKDGIVFLELTGGCQGCSQAGATMKDGIETSLRQRISEVKEVRDVTKHTNGMNPFM
jgi:Fe/S biogenesis protein NfuA